MRRRLRRGAPGGRVGLLVSLAVVLVVVVAACGGDDDSSDAPSEPEAAITEGGDTASGYIYAGTQEQTDEAATAGEEAAGETTTPPAGWKIGVIQLSAQSATSILITESVMEIADAFGYEVEVCDPNFDPQKVPQCATSIVAGSPDMIISVSTNAGGFGAAFQDAADQGIPWFGTGSGSVEEANLIDYGIPGFDLAATLDEFMFQDLNDRFADVDPKEVLALVAPTVGEASLNQQSQLQEDSAAEGGIELNEHDLDLTDIVQDTLQTSRQALEQNPELAGMWTVCDFCVPLMAQVVDEIGPETRPFIGGQFSNPEAVAGLRDGTVSAIADYPWDLPAWVAIDQALAADTQGAEIVPDFSVFDTYSLPFMEPYLLTEANALDSGAAPLYGPDYRTFFTDKWQNEYGVTL